MRRAACSLCDAVELGSLRMRIASCECMIERMPERLCRGSAEWKLVVGRTEWTSAACKGLQGAASLCTSSASMCVDAARNSA